MNFNYTDTFIASVIVIGSAILLFNFLRKRLHSKQDPDTEEQPPTDTAETHPAEPENTEHYRY